MSLSLNTQGPLSHLLPPRQPQPRQSIFLIDTPCSILTHSLLAVIEEELAVFLDYHSSVATNTYSGSDLGNCPLGNEAILADHRAGHTDLWIPYASGHPVVPLPLTHDLPAWMHLRCIYMRPGRNRRGRDGHCSGPGNTALMTGASLSACAIMSNEASSRDQWLLSD